jgi:5'-3' exonuclease
MKAFLTGMAEIEYDMVVTNLKKSRARFPDTILKKHTSHPLVSNKPNVEASNPGEVAGTVSASGSRILTIDFPAYRAEYYEAKFNGVPVKTIVHEYLRGMLFVLRYYLDKIPSWSWNYPFYYGVFFAEMCQHIDDYDTSEKFDEGIPLSPLEQLVSVLPGSSAHLLPEPLRMLSTSPDSPIIDMFPTEFEIDLEGKKQEYEAIILLPPADASRIRQAFSELEFKLNDYDRARNAPGKVYTYSRNGEGKVAECVLDE